MTDAVSQIDGAHVGHPPGPGHHLPEHPHEGGLALGLPGPQGARVLGETLGHPTVPVRAGSDAVAPPLMGKFMGEEEAGDVVERRRVVLESPAHQGRALLQNDQARRRVTARHRTLPRGPG